MSWQMRCWAWRLQGPLHVGYPPAGALNRARLYVPARALWGAVTAELARRLAGRGNFPHYQEVGEAVGKQIRFTYLYPAQRRERGWRLWLPTYRAGQGLSWMPRTFGRNEERHEGDVGIPDRLFRRRLLHGRASTSVAPGSLAAEDGSLRETECIQPFWASDTPGEGPEPLFMAGTLFVHDDFAYTEALNNLQDLFIGGDTRYGLGHLQRALWETDGHERGPGYAFAEDDEDTPVITLDPDMPVLGHASTEDIDSQVSGAQELVTSWDRRSQAGQRLFSDGGQAEPLWVPGSHLPNIREWTIRESGTWHSVHLKPEGTAP